MPGGLLQLAAYGSENQYLNGNPQITFFKMVYKRHTNFAMEAIEVSLSGPDELAWNDKIKLKTKIPRNADLMSNIYLKVKLPDIKSDTKHQFYWVKNVGLRLVDYIDIYIGGARIERLDAHFMDIEDHLVVSTDQSEAFSKMVGGEKFMNHYGSLSKKYTTEYYPGYDNEDITYDTDNQVNRKNKFYNSPPSIFNRELFIPLNFWFTKNPGLSLPLIALQYHDIEIEIQLNSIRELYTIVELDKEYTYYGTNRHYGSVGTIKDKRDGLAIGWNDVEAIPGVDLKTFKTYRRIKPETNDKDTHISQFIFGEYANKAWNLEPSLDINYIFLDECERKQFAQTSHQYLIEQTQRINFKGNVGKTTHLLELYHPVKELYFVTQRSDSDERNQWNNYTNYPDEDVAGDIFDFQDNWWHDAINNEYTLLGRNDDRFQEWIFRYGPNGEAGDPATPLGFVINTDNELYSIDEVITMKKNWRFTHAYEIPGITEQNFDFYRGDVFHRALLKFNGNERQGEKTEKYYHLIQPYQHHTRTPSEGINVYSFSINPEKFQPSGACNMSRLKNIEFQLEYKRPPLNPTGSSSKYKWTYDTDFHIISYNVLKITGGLAGLTFAN